MRKLRSLWRGVFDVREGEGLRTLFMALYLLTVLFAYYIVKPVSRAMFVDQMDIDKLPYLYILIAIVGGVLASLYTRVAVQTSLRSAVTWATVVAIVCLLGFWWVIPRQLPSMLYVFNIWVSLFGVVLVSQGWLVASNVFSTREAKRLYGLVGLGAILGAWFGSVVTTFTVKLVGVPNLLIASALLVGISYGFYRLTVAQAGLPPTRAPAAKDEGAKFTTRDILADIHRHRHLQIITAIIVITFVVDVLVEYQLQASGKLVYKGTEAYSAFLSRYYLYQNIVTFALQLLLTGAIVRRLGVGGTLQLMPVTIAAASAVAAAAPNTVTAQIARLTEACDRYTFNRTGMELLYLPLPIELRNRTKAFVDVFVDRMGRGLGGIILLGLGYMGLTDLSRLPLVVIAFCVVWIVLSVRAQREYLRTVRGRLEARRLDLEAIRISVEEPATIRMLETAARGENPRQARYALSLLAEVQGYTLEPLLQGLAGSPSREVREEVYRQAGLLRFPGILDQALTEIGIAGGATAAVGYALAVAPNRLDLADRFLNHSDPIVTESALEALCEQPEIVRGAVTREWLSHHAADANPEQRRLAAVAIGVRGDEGTEALYSLLDDPDPPVAAAAFRAAGRLKNRAYLNAIVSRLADSRVRGAAIEALAAYGTRISGTLEDVLEDLSVPVAVRRQIPRVLKMAPEQRNVDLLLRSIGHPDLSVRASVLKALNNLRETAPALDFGAVFVTRQILSEARTYFELNAALAPFREQRTPRTASGLLAASIEERLKQTLERLFRLLGLRYPPKEIYAAYLAVNRGRGDQFAAALEFLDTVLDRELKRILLPLLDDASHLAERGRDLFGVEIKQPEQAVRELIRSGDPWLVVCAMAAAAELRFRSLAPDITDAARNAGAEVGHVALAAQSALA